MEGFCIVRVGEVDGMVMSCGEELGGFMYSESSMVVVSCNLCSIR